MDTYVLLSGLGASIFPFQKIKMESEGITPEQLKKELAGKTVTSFIGHPTTRDIIVKLLQEGGTQVIDKGREEFHIQPGMKVVMYVVALPRRQQQSGQDVAVQSIEELIIRRVEVLSSS